MKLEELNVDEFILNSNFNKDDLDRVVKSIKTNDVKLNELFVLLEPYLVSTDTQKRLKSVKFITNLIINLDLDYLNDAEATHLNKFLCSKLEDHYTIAPAVLPGLNFLLRCKNLNSDEKFNLIKSLLRDIHVQSLVQGDRHLVYMIFFYILNSTELVALIQTAKFDSDFVYGFIQSMDSEKDPRNLVMCFKCIPLICKHLSIKRFTEELFDVFSCYFPIDFTPPSDDPNGITKEELVSLLRGCVAASPLFAKLAIPLILDKLDSEIDSARLDSLLTFVECAKVYDATDYKEYIEQLWNNYQRLAMSTTSQQIEEASLKAIEYLTLNISKSAQIEKTLLSLDTFIEKCIQCCIIYLKDADLKLVWPSAKCLLAISSATETAFILVIKVLIQFLLEQYSMSTQVNQRRIYLDLLIKFLTNGQKYSQTNACSYIFDSRNEILNVCFDIFNSSDLKHQLETQALGLVECLVRYKNILKTIDCQALFKQLWDGELWTSSNQEQIIRIILPIVNEYDSLFDYAFNSLDYKLAADQKQTVEVLRLLSQLNTISSKLNLKLQTLISAFSVANVSSSGSLMLDLIEIYKNLITFNQASETINENKELFNQNLLNYLKFLLNEFKMDGNLEALTKASHLFQIYASKLTSKSIYEEISKMVYAKVDQLKSLELSSPASSIYMIHIQMQFVASLNNQTFNSEIKDSFQKFNQQLFSLATLHQDDHVNLLSSQFYASLVNKVLDDDLLNATLSDAFINSLISEIETNQNLRTLQFWVWLTKALLLREHKQYERFMGKLLDWLDNEKLTLKASQSFFVLLNEFDDLMRRDKTNANVKLFYKQRFFNFVIHQLKEKFHSKENQNFKISYVTALSSTLRFLPKNIIQQQLPTMLPMLVYSLNNNQGDENLWLCSLQSLEDLITQTTTSTGKSANNHLVDYLQEVLQKLYQLSKYQPNMEIRIISLNCLYKLTNLQPNLLIKFQREVVKNIEPCLNDKKRLVRQRAVLARNKWYLLTTKDD